MFSDGSSKPLTHENPSEAVKSSLLKKTQSNATTTTRLSLACLKMTLPEAAGLNNQLILVDQDTLNKKRVNETKPST